MIHQRIQEEIKQADDKYGNFNSTHEVYGVLMEEVEEFWDFVKLNTVESQNVDGVWGYKKADKVKNMISELIQISAIAKRAALQLQNNNVKHV